MHDYKIDYLKAFCAVFVIMFHSIYHLMAEYGCRFSRLFDTITAPIYAHVSIFIVVAGYLCHEQALKPYYKKKFIRIIIPFLVFSLLKILYGVLISGTYAHADSVLIQMYDALILGRLYWFSYCIFLLFCLAPLLWKMTKKHPAFSFVVLIIALGICIADDETGFLSVIPYFQLNRVIQYLLYFIAGYIFQLYREKISSLLKNDRWHLCTIAAILVYLVIYFIIPRLGIGMRPFFDFLQRLSVMVVLYKFAGLCRPNSVVRKIAKYSYQLMLIDSFTRVVILNIIDKVFTVSVYWMIPQTVLSVVSCVLICDIFSRWKATRFLLGIS